MTFLTRKNRAAALALSTISMAGIGCSTPNISKNPASVADQPQADEATALRGWQKSAALYQSGTTQGYPTRFYYATNPESTTAFNFVGDSVMMIVQTITLPPVLLIDYPFRKVYYEGDVLPASYTAMPPLAPEKPFGPPNPDPDPLSMGRAPLLPPLPPIPVQHPGLIISQETTLMAPVPRAQPKPTVMPPPNPKPSGTVTPTPPAKVPPTTRPGAPLNK